MINDLMLKPIFWQRVRIGWPTMALLLGLLLLVPACGAPSTTANRLAGPRPGSAIPLSNTVVMIIRHAEKPASGSGLSPEGRARAEAYVNYFKKLRLGSQRLAPDYIVAADDSDHSQRSRLTVEPLAESLGLKPDLRFQAKRPQDLAQELRAREHGKVMLICWHHREIPELLEDLGANAAELLPEGQWPAQQFGWVIRLCYDENGQLKSEGTKRIKEHLMPGD